MKKILIFLGVCSIIPLILAPAIHYPKATAAETFSNNNIISDSVFNNAGSMTATDIDAFLNGFPSSCISPNSGFSAIDPTGYNPTSGFLYGGYVSAGKVIYDASQAYGLNPQVLLATLEKEQNLVIGQNNFSGYCNNGDQHKYAAAAGYGCPDGGTTYSYTGISLYRRNGTVVSSTGTTCVNSSAKAGFSQQVIRAAWLLKFGQQRSLGNVGWAVIRGSWNNLDDLQSCYGGPMTQGTWQRCPSGGSAYYDGYTIIDGTSVHIESGATAALYWYTPHFSGNQHFFDIFTRWFGSTQESTFNCNSKVANIVCVWSVIKTDGTQFLTSSKSELYTTITSYGWTFNGIAFYGAQSQEAGMIPVHRLRQGGTHYYTADPVDYNNKKASGDWVDEGIVFYAYPPATSGSVSYNVYALQNEATGAYYWTTDATQKEYLISLGYEIRPETFRSFSGVIKLPTPPAGRDNIYRLKEGSGYFYTTTLGELETVLSLGYPYQGVLTTANASNSGVPVYRLQYGSSHFYTTSLSERDYAIHNYGMTYEGIKFYLDNSSALIYRLLSVNSGQHLYTSSLSELMSLVNKGWVYETTLASDTSSSIPIYRLFGKGEHFYSSNLNEVTSIVNDGWQYETVAFETSKTSTQPVYRLYGSGDHFYTTSTTERDQAVSKYGYKYEGVKFYVSDVPTSTPVYRLYGHGEHFYTTDLTEKNEAVSKYGYKYEGISFYVT